MAISNSVGDQALTSVSTPKFTNVTLGIASTATSGGTVTLTVSSAQTQIFTGSSTETVVLPVVSTLNLNQTFRIINTSSGNVTVQSSGLNTIQVMGQNSSLLVTCISNSGTGTASWLATYNPLAPFSFPLAPSLGGTGIANTDANTLTISGVSSINQNVTTTGTPAFASMSTANLSFDSTANTIASTNTNGNIFLSANGTGSYIIGAAGGANPDGAFSGLKNVGVPGTRGGYYAQYQFTNNATGSQFVLGKSRSTSIGSFVTVQSGDTLGQVSGFGDDGTTFSLSSRISLLAQGTISSGIVPGQITLATANTSGSLTTAMTISNAQVVTLANALPVASGGTGITSFGTGVATALGVNTNSTGGFPVETDGTFTPTFLVGNSGTGITYTTQTGIYSRVGNTVTIEITIVLSSNGIGAGTVTIGGLPFASRFSAVNSIFPVVLQNVTFAGVPGATISQAGASTITLISTVTGTTVSLLQNTAFTNTSVVLISGTYMI